MKTTRLRKTLIGTHFFDRVSTTLRPEDSTSPAGFDLLAERLTDRRRCPICGSCVPWLHRFDWCLRMLEKRDGRC